MMDIKEALEYCWELEHYYVDESGELSKFIKSQQQTIEDLKCCENCRHERDDHNTRCEFCTNYSRWESNYVQHV